ncbi:MAG: hypothetical protein WCA46_13500 [Actinocatenispora sp.]
MDSTDVFAVVVVVVAISVLYIVPIVICGLKGKQNMITLGVFFHPVWWVCAIRLAKPASWWARRYYGPEKLARADERFGSHVVDSTAWATDEDEDDKRVGSRP